MLLVRRYAYVAGAGSPAVARSPEHTAHTTTDKGRVAESIRPKELMQNKFDETETVNS